MNSPIAQKAGLVNKDVWIIDDEIPIHRAPFENGDMIEGSRPIDRGALLSLLAETDLDDWNEPAVRDLCEQLVEEAANVTAFTQPGAAIAFLGKMNFPDVVVYDLNYRTYPDKAKVLDCLEGILSKCVSLVQVYTQEPVERANDELRDLLTRFPTRLHSPIQKADTGAEDLASSLDAKLEKSLSVHLSEKIRRLSATAVENVLVKIDDLPLDVAMRMLAGENEDLLADTELVELISEKVGNAIKSTSELGDAISKYAGKKGIPSASIPRFIDDVVELLVTNVREQIQYDRWLYKAIGSALHLASNNPENRDRDRIEEIVQEFFAFRLYDQPGDDLVRTGDIIFRKISASQDKSPKELPDLYLVLTPACDLAYFWKKTRGVITVVRMRPITKDKIREYGNNRNLPTVSSVTADHNPIIFPALPLAEGNRGDYAMFVYEITSIKLNGVGLSGVPRKRYSQPLTYQELIQLGEIFERKCRISEPFLTGVLAELRNHLFRAGVPDFPDEEKARLKNLL